MSDFDIVCLQEVDLGGRRSGYISQLDALQTRGGFDHAVSQINRTVGKTSIHGNAILSRFPIEGFEDHKLPSRIPGRGKLIAQIEGLAVVNTHLSLDAKTQNLQLESVAARLKPHQKRVVMGDLNCLASAPHLLDFAQKADLHLLTHVGDKTYPSWRPRQGLDHILVSDHFQTAESTVHDFRLSDHLPVSIEIKKP